MPKLISLIKKKSQLSDEDFASYYETHHAPLIKNIFPMLSRYERTFLPASSILFGEFSLGSEKEEKPYDVITELWFKDDSDLESFMAHAIKPDILEVIRNDEAKFLRSECTVTYRVNTP
ncbi:MAG: EthD domain-containing protein [SAR86 cluster bacterium]|nr:EthD domain-containing protein [SAR86 cluster bacterium]|tara:strand:- start:692 stop:1048 length:357 start_codon:yes stop_codon:yes gene_type:complete